MIYKSLLKTAIFLTAIIVCSVSCKSSARPVINYPKQVVVDFYQVYLSAVNDPDTESGLMKSKIAVDKYTTKNLRKLQDMDDSGADYFFAAQDICPDWLDHINITHENIKEYSADLKLYLGLGNSLSIYDVHLVMKNSQWLLDSVKSHSRKTEACY